MRRSEILPLLFFLKDFLFSLEIVLEDLKIYYTVQMILL